MNKLFLIIGPSGVGKTSAINNLIPCENLLKFTLDSIIKDYDNEASISKYFSRIGNKLFFERSIEAIEKLKSHNHDNIILIDVGAGSFDWPGCIETYLKYPIISLTGDQEVLYNRILNRQNEKRTLHQYVTSEFMPHKSTLYDKAKFKIDTSNMNSEEVSQKISSIVCNSSY